MWSLIQSCLQAGHGRPLPLTKNWRKNETNKRYYLKKTPRKQERKKSEWGKKQHREEKARKDQIIFKMSGIIQKGKGLSLSIFFFVVQQLFQNFTREVNILRGKFSLTLWTCSINRTTHLLVLTNWTSSLTVRSKKSGQADYGHN